MKQCIFREHRIMSMIGEMAEKVNPKSFLAGDSGGFDV